MHKQIFVTLRWPRLSFQEIMYYPNAGFYGNHYGNEQRSPAGNWDSSQPPHLPGTSNYATRYLQQQGAEQPAYSQQFSQPSDPVPSNPVPSNPVPSNPVPQSDWYNSKVRYHTNPANKYKGNKSSFQGSQKAVHGNQSKFGMNSQNSNDKQTGASLKSSAGTSEQGETFNSGAQNSHPSFSSSQSKLGMNLHNSNSTQTNVSLRSSTGTSKQVQGAFNSGTQNSYPAYNSSQSGFGMSLQNYKSGQRSDQDDPSHVNTDGYRGSGRGRGRGGASKPGDFRAGKANKVRALQILGKPFLSSAGHFRHWTE